MEQEKIQTKVAQMNKTEWDKYKEGKRFNVNIVTKTRAKVTLEDVMSEIKTIKSDMIEVKSDIAQLKADVVNIKGVLERNNLH
ncbi:MAG: hypothetical protein LBV37_00465 [Mycoplasmataceae bacterium]|jgi:hypothetical protein|nr:hypothetical protein [Mycoplasmataceae bacterium]